MSYDLKHVKVPRLAGAGLRALVGLVENPITRRALTPKLFQDMGLTDFRALHPTDAPTVYPEHPAPADAPRAADPQPLQSLCAATTSPEGFAFHTISDFHTAYASGALDPCAVAEQVIAAIAASDRGDTPLRAFIAVNPNDLRAQAEASAARWRAGAPLGPLDGVPVGVKDELDQAGYPTTVGTRFMGKSGPATQDATSVARLRAAGALLIGKCNMHEIGIGTTGINTHHGSARNPYDLWRCTGGSSSGSAAAVAAGLCPVALGADGGGSVRLPAALCGVVGLKPTFGCVSEAGAAPLCWSVAHIGPLAANAFDAALVQALICGADPLDPHSLHQPPLHLDGFLSDDLSDLRVGVFTPWLEDAAPEIVQACRAQLTLLQSLGAQVVEVTLPDLEAARVAHLVSIAAEMATSMEAHYATHRADFGLDVRVNLALARTFTARDYIRAQRVRTAALQNLSDAFRIADVILTPSTGRTAPPRRPDARPPRESAHPPVIDLMRFATLANLTGVPAISYPVAYDGDGLPIGCQLMGRPWSEALLLRLARLGGRALTRLKPRLHFDILPK
jgi:Asp-tRNA(Asn)/Glu-tRNA(Gln) amidotransferase A subunit family amidase